MRYPTLGAAALAVALMAAGLSVGHPAGAGQPPKDPPPAPVPETSPLAAAVAADNRLAVTLLPPADGKPENTIVSPYGVLSVLAVLRPGANGDTAAEMDTVLGVPKGQSPATLLTGAAALRDFLSASSPQPFGLSVEPAMPAGVRVTAVADRSPAATAGLKPKDLILSVNREPATPAALEKALAGLGSAVQLDVQGEDGSKTRVVLLPEATDPTRYRVRAANGVWGQANLRFEPAYAGLLGRYYPPGIQPIDFTAGGGDPARQSINKWVAAQTGGEIAELFAAKEIAADTQFVVVSTLSFEAGWAIPFDPAITQPSPFHVVPARNPLPTVPLMNQRGRFPYRKGDGFQVVELPFKGGRASLVVVVPDQPDGLPAVLARLAKQPADVLGGTAPAFLDVGLPRFKVRTRNDLRPTLARLGMPTAFDPRKADLTGIAEGRGLVVSALVQEATLEVDEKGARAAAATGGGLIPKAVPEAKVYADRPFYFAIRDGATGAVLFNGVYVDPPSPGK